MWSLLRRCRSTEFEIDGRDRRRVQLVFPGDANIDEDKISILTPIGTALIGLAPGQMMMVRSHDDRPHKLSVLSVAQPISGES
jgi:regulator of nucleoside diphosphate kinase